MLSKLNSRMTIFIPMNIDTQSTFCISKSKEVNMLKPYTYYTLDIDLDYFNVPLNAQYSNHSLTYKTIIL